MNWRLAFVLYAMSSVVVVGGLLTAVLAMGFEDSQSVTTAIVTGFILSLPATYVATRVLVNFTDHLKYH